MCTVIKKTQFNRPKTAKKDIIVYKCGDINNDKQNFISNYERFVYIPGNTYETKFVYSDFDSVSDDIEHQYLLTGIRVVYVVKGFHSFKSIQRMIDGENYFKINAEFIIPKGAKYYENECGNLVSNQIKFIKFI